MHHEAPPVDEEIDSLRAKRFVVCAVSELPERDRSVLALRFGAEFGLDEIGALFNLSKERVRQIVNRGLDRVFKAARQAGVQP